jgi:hypothetical protein
VSQTDRYSEEEALYNLEIRHTRFERVSCHELIDISEEEAIILEIRIIESCRRIERASADTKDIFFHGSVGHSIYWVFDIVLVVESDKYKYEHIVVNSHNRNSQS